MKCANYKKNGTETRNFSMLYRIKPTTLGSGHGYLSQQGASVAEMVVVGIVVVVGSSGTGLTEIQSDC